MKKTKLFSLLLLGLVCSVGNVWADSQTIKAGTESSAAFTYSDLSAYSYDNKYWAKKTDSEVIDIDKNTTFTFTNASGVTISAITVKGCAQDNGDLSSTITITDDNETPHSVSTGSKTWTGRKTTTPTEATISSGISDLKMTAGTVYTVKNSNDNNIAIQIVITYTTGSGGGGSTSHNVIAETSTGTDANGTVSAAQTSIAEEATTTITAVPAVGKKVTNWAVSGENASIDPAGASNSFTTTLTMGTEDATVIVTFGDANQLDMTHSLTNVTKTSGAVGENAIYELAQYTAVFAAGAGYVLPSSILVTAGGSNITANCTWDKATGTVTIPAQYVTGNIVITIAGEEKVDATFNLKNSSFVVAGTTIDGITFATTGSPDDDYLNFTGSGGTMTISAENTKRITKVVITYTDTKNDRTGGGDALTVSPYDDGYDIDGKVGTWESEYERGESSVVFTVANKARVETVVVTYINTVTITPAYDKTTYVTTKKLDFAGVAPSGLKAYVATSASASGVVMTELDAAVPVGTPLLLIGTAGTTYYVPIINTVSAPETNLLVAGDGETVFDGTTDDYLLYSDGLFYKIGSGSVATNKAYLHLDSAPSGVAGLRIIFDVENTTDIQNIMTVENNDKAVKFFDNGQLFIKKNDVVYDAMGRAIR